MVHISVHVRTYRAHHLVKITTHVRSVVQHIISVSSLHYDTNVHARLVEAVWQITEAALINVLTATTKSSACVLMGSSWELTGRRVWTWTSARTMIWAVIRFVSILRDHTNVVVETVSIWSIIRMEVRVCVKMWTSVPWRTSLDVPMVVSIIWGQLNVLVPLPWSCLSGKGINQNHCSLFNPPSEAKIPF